MLYCMLTVLREKKPWVDGILSSIYLNWLVKLATKSIVNNSAKCEAVPKIHFKFRQTFFLFLRKPFRIWNTKCRTFIGTKLAFFALFAPIKFYRPYTLNSTTSLANIIVTLYNIQYTIYICFSTSFWFSYQ